MPRPIDSTLPPQFVHQQPSIPFENRIDDFHDAESGTFGILTFFRIANFVLPLFGGMASGGGGGGTEASGGMDGVLGDGRSSGTPALPADVDNPPPSSEDGYPVTTYQPSDPEPTIPDEPTTPDEPIITYQPSGPNK